MHAQVHATLRPYQQAGVDWLAFLRRFGLHGILCDDMGLGKTLQTLCVLAASAHERRQLRAAHDVDAHDGTTNDGDARGGGSTDGESTGDGAHGGAGGSLDGSLPPLLPSLVVCPTTLTGHWAEEARKYCGASLSTLELVGSASQRAKLLARGGAASHELVIVSYETLRANIEALCKLRWDYVVLDEGHVIRNPKAKLTLAAKRLRSSRRLILSGALSRPIVPYRSWLLMVASDCF